jgi:Ca-activated chloride channel family protein
MLRGKSKLLVTALSAGIIGAYGVLGTPLAASADDKSVLGQDGGSLVLVLDGSGSMKESSGTGGTRMDAAKKGLRSVINQLPSDSKVGLRVYGSTISDGKGSCKDTQLLAPVADVDKHRLKQGVNKLKPLGNTPIAYSLQQAYKDLPSEGPRSIVLVSDGEENCGGNPCKVARDLKKKGAHFYIDVVGLQVDASSRDQLTCVASAGGGTYYDVSKLSDLSSTLTRTSVRAARGYQEAGQPIEGGTSAASAVKVADGQWLDTIGDSNTEYYAMPDVGKGTLHVSASTRTTSAGLSDTESLTMTLINGAGRTCGEPANTLVQGSVNQKAPYTVSIDTAYSDRRECGKGPYVVAVSPPEIKGIKPLELLVRSEPAVKATAGLPGGVPDTRYSDDTKADEKPSGSPVPAAGSPSFAGAPPVAPGLYSDSILPGETLLYRVPNVGWGQTPVCDFTLKSTATAARALNSAGYSETTGASIYGPMKADVAEANASLSRDDFRGNSDGVVHVAGPRVNYLNRESGATRIAPASLDGSYYCALTLFTSTPSVDAEVGEVPVQLAVAINGTAGQGKPSYVSKPPSTDPSAPGTADDGGSNAVWLIGGVVVVLALLAAVWAWLRSRRSKDSAAADAGGSGAPPKT